MVLMNKKGESGAGGGEIPRLMLNSLAVLGLIVTSEAMDSVELSIMSAKLTTEAEYADERLWSEQE